MPKDLQNYLVPAEWEERQYLFPANWSYHDAEEWDRVVNELADEWEETQYLYPASWSPQDAATFVVFG